MPKKKQTITATDQPEIHLSVERCSKKLGIQKILSLIFPSVCKDDWLSKQAQELLVFYRQVRDLGNQRHP